MRVSGSTTFNYDYRQALDQSYLVPFEVESHTTFFLREDTYYSDARLAARTSSRPKAVTPNLVEHDPNECRPGCVQ